ncbi:MAG: hypothetical protein IPN10_12860 [Saprospiraceae bacterium]|nr:hypothetical protein [Saprospiraceae bacterium]
MNDQKFLKAIIEFLSEDENINEEVIRLHWIPDVNRPNDMSLIFKRLCESAQNAQMGPNVISKSIGGIQKLSEITNNFDPKFVASKFSRNNTNAFLDLVKLKLNPKGKIRLTSKSVWPKFCNAVVDGAHFLNKFENPKQFYQYLDKLYNSKETKNLLPICISLEIRGFGIALASDFLKEIGLINYGKPDIHLIEILKASKHLDINLKNKFEICYEVLNIVDKIAENTNHSAYEIDKTIWLIGSGNYYKSGIKTRNRKKEFIERISKMV